MHRHLTKKAKKRKLAKARRRAQQWSIKQQTVASLKKSSSTNQSTSTPIHTNISTRDSNLKTPEVVFNSPSPDKYSDTIQAIQQTLSDLEEQKKAINITIGVLQRRLNFLLNSKTPK